MKARQSASILYLQPSLLRYNSLHMKIKFVFTAPSLFFFKTLAQHRLRLHTSFWFTGFLKPLFGV